MGRKEYIYVWLDLNKAFGLYYPVLSILEAKLNQGSMVILL